MADSPVRTKIPGPERPTIIERLLLLIPLPYALSCVIVAALIGPPAQLLSLYLDTGNINEAFARNAINNGLGIDPLLNTPPLTGNIASFVYFIFIALSLYGTRFMRTRIVAMEKKLLEISPSEETYHRAFGGIIKTKFTILLVAILMPYMLRFRCRFTLVTPISSFRS